MLSQLKAKEKGVPRSCAWVIQSASTTGALGRVNGKQQPPVLPVLPTDLCPAGTWSKRRHWALIFLSQQLYRMMELFVVAVSKNVLVPWLVTEEHSVRIFFHHFIVNMVFSECSCIQWLKSYYILKCNYWLGSVLTQYLSHTAFPQFCFVAFAEQNQQRGQIF